MTKATLNDEVEITVIVRSHEYETEIRIMDAIIRPTYTEAAAELFDLMRDRVIGAAEFIGDDMERL